MDALTINEAAETTGWSPRMLRYIERMGLVEPPRSTGGYRLYGPGELQRLRTLRELLDTLLLWNPKVVLDAGLREMLINGAAPDAQIEPRAAGAWLAALAEFGSGAHTRTGPGWQAWLKAGGRGRSRTPYERRKHPAKRQF